ncbi:MAG: alpha/beta hydrolase [Lachnospiraceae bacterium]|nr:alpha/beta hydrolase [Lachnospiraceae bacterium]
MADKKKSIKRLIWLLPIAVLVIAAAVFLIYVEDYYHADALAVQMLESDEQVQVTQTDYGWFFDGPSQEDGLIFYPGGKVEETAYAPLLHMLAREGMDVCLVRMPFRLAVFGADKAAGVMERYDYDHWSIGGHSLGGVMASSYAAKHSEAFTSLILLASYSTAEVDDSLTVVQIYGSEDQVLNRESMEKNRDNLPEAAIEYVIPGGNHAQFGSYGPQEGDGLPTISGQEQVEKTVEKIIDSVLPIIWTGD